jgi:hypothetical protein
VKDAFGVSKGVSPYAGRVVLRLAPKAAEAAKPARPFVNSSATSTNISTAHNYVIRPPKAKPSAPKPAAAAVKPTASAVESGNQAVNQARLAMGARAEKTRRMKYALGTAGLAGAGGAAVIGADAAKDKYKSKRFHTAA